MINIEQLYDTVSEDAKSFGAAEPFLHLVKSDFLDPANVSTLSKAFPHDQWEGWYNADHVHQRLKMTCDDIARIPNDLGALLHELNSGPFLKYLTKLSGIEGLLPDPFLEGGGLHLTKPGGTLTPHIDFHQGKSVQMYRRLNLLVYLNDDWRDGDGGELELWPAKGSKPAVHVQPHGGTMVVFRTDTKSLHGFTNPVARLNRRSVAVYYYTVEDAGEFSGSGTTYWRSTSIRNPGLKLPLLWLERLFLFASKAFASLSWRMSAIADKIRSRLG